jgi:glutamate---cysteine ligase / carboxylate-amine ligase
MDTPETPLPGKSDDLIFHASPETTLGVEIELQILDRDTGDLAPGAVRILKACEEEKIEGTAAELMQSMIEVKTSVCRNVDEARDQLFPRIRKVRNIASSLGFELAMAGTHPFHRTAASTVYPAERYEKILDRLAWLTYQRVMFGLHIHVGMPSGDLAIGAMSLLTQYMPHLIALSASSPFWQGVDTGLASSRVALYRLLPHAGLPLYFGNWKEFRNYCRVMKDCQTIDSFKDIYWDIRPRPDFGTIEFRICDIPLTLTEALRLVALVRSLSVYGLRLLQEKPRLKRGDIKRHWIAVENKWLATRYGLQALYIRTPSGKRRGLAHDLTELIDRLLPIAQEIGDEKYLAGLKPIDKFQTGADRQRHHYREIGNWKGLVDYLIGQLLQDLESYHQAPS